MPKYYDEIPDRADPALYADLVAEFNKSRRRKSCPYVLFGYIGQTHLPQDSAGKVYKDVLEPRLFKLDIGTIHGTVNDLERYTARGWIILDFWIPTAEEIPDGTQRGDVLVRHGWAMDLRSEEGRKRMREMRGAILKAKGDTDKLAEMKGALSTSQREKAELERRLKEAEAKLGRKSNG